MKMFLEKNKHIISLSAITITFFLFWLFSFLSTKNIIDSRISEPLEGVAYILCGTAIGTLLIFVEDMFYTISIAAFFSFLTAQIYGLKTIPIPLIVSLAIIVVGIIVSSIKNRFIIKKGPFFSGVVALAAACVLGGLFNFTDSYWIQLFGVLAMAFGVAFVYIFLTSHRKVEFKELAYIFTFLAIYISLQCFVCILTQPDPRMGLLKKCIDLGWGVANNVGMILLMILPFSFYLSHIENGTKKIIFTFVSYLIILTIYFTYSRGAIVSLVLELVGLLIYRYFISKNKQKYLVLNGSIIAAIIICFTMFAIIKPGDLQIMIENFSGGIKIDSLNGRSPIYEQFFNQSFDRFVFGHGMFAPLDFRIDVAEGQYQWGHGTFIHTFYTMGFVGLIALVFHLYQKYYYLFKEHSVATILVAIGFLGSGFYGLFDVSYYYISYMILLMLILAYVPIDNAFKEGEDPIKSKLKKLFLKLRKHD